MARYNEYFRDKWAGCRLLAEARDEHRNRDVLIYMIPGEFDIVGVTDGVDCWVCPTCINPFSANIQRILADIRSGKTPDVPKHSDRRRVQVQPVPVPRRKIQVPQQTQGAPRRVITLHS